MKRNRCSSTSVKDNLTWCGSLFLHKGSRLLFANASGPSPQRSRMYPYGFPWLPQQGKRATDSVTINAAILLMLAFAAMTQKSTPLLLTTSEERGEAHFGEPCSWWQTVEVKILAKLGATKGALYTCELARRWSQVNIDKPGSLGFMTNIPCSGAVQTGWPRCNAITSTRLCTCQGQRRNQHTQQHVQNFLHALPRLPEERESLNMVKERGNRVITLRVGKLSLNCLFAGRNNN